MKILEGAKPLKKGDKVKYAVKMKGEQYGAGKKTGEPDNRTDQTGDGKD